MSERIKFKPKAQEIVSELSSIRLVAGFYRHCKGRDLGGYLQRHLLPSIKKDMEEGVISVPIVVGYPGNGKTWLLRRVNKLIDVTFPKLKKENSRDTFTFEGDGLRPARAVGFILTGPEQERADEEIEVASGYVRWGMREMIKTPGIRVVTAELPFVTQLVDDSKEESEAIGLDAGTSAVLQLLEPDAQGKYQLPPYRVYIIGQIGGQLIRKISRESRDQIKNAPDLKTAKILARRYKKRIPQNKAELQTLKLEGASAKTMEKYRRKLAEVVTEMRQRRVRMLPHPAQLSEEVFIKQERAVRESIQDATADSLGDPIAIFMNHPYLNMIQETRIFQFLFSRTLKKVSKDILGPSFVGLNEPNTNELLVV